MKCRICWMALLLAIPVLSAQPPGARDLVRRAVALELEKAAEANDYTYRYREVERKMEGRVPGPVVRDETFDVVNLYGRPFTRLIAQAGNPLPPDAERKAAEKLDKAVAKRARLTEEQRAREDDKLRQQARERIEFIREIPDLYNFRIAGQETIEGRAAWVVDAEPRPDAKPRSLWARNLRQLYGRLWIDQGEERWVRVEAQAHKTVSVGWILARVAPDSRVIYEQTRVAEGVWLPKRMQGRFVARFLGVRVAIDRDVNYFDYRRFATESRISAGEP